MVKTLEELARQKDALFRKHPELRDVRVLPLKDLNLTYEEISSFIEKCWNNDYSNEARIKFSPELMKHNIMNLSNNKFNLIAIKDDRIQSALLGFETPFSDQNSIVDSIISTGLSTDPKMRGTGLSQLIWIEQMRILGKENYAFSIHWIDSRHNSVGSSSSIYTGDNGKMEIVVPIWLYGKPVDYKKAVEVGKLKLYEKLGARLSMNLFPSRNNISTKFDIQKYSSSYIEECLAFVMEFQKSNKIKRNFTKETLDTHLSFNEGKISSTGLILRKKGKVMGLLYGYTNPVGKDSSYFQIDGIIFHPDLTYTEKKNFLGATEYFISSQYGCFSSIAPSTVSEENLTKYGYVPIIKQALAINKYNNSTNIDSGQLKNLFIELR